MEDRRIPKDFLYCELTSGSHSTGRPSLRFKDMCKRNMKTCRIQQAELEVEVSNHAAWRAKVKESLKSAKEKRELEREEKRTSRHQRTQPVPFSHTTPASDYTCSKCQRSWKSRIGLYSHSRHFSETKCVLPLFRETEGCYHHMSIFASQEIAVHLALSTTWLSMTKRYFTQSVLIKQSLIDYLRFYVPVKRFSLYEDVTITDEWLQYLRLCLALRAIEQGGIFIVPRLLGHGTSVFPLSSEGPIQSPRTTHMGKQRTYSTRGGRD
jgi:hypothetical protein